MDRSQFGHDLRAAAREGRSSDLRDLLHEGVPPDEPDDHGHTALSLAALFGHVEAMALLLDAGADVNTRDRADLTVLMLAAAVPRPQVVKVLLMEGADVNAVASDGRTALLNAIWSIDSTAAVVAVLIDAGADTRVTDENYGLSPRQWADKTGKKDVAELLGGA